MFVLGISYYNGQSVKKNYTKAFEYYKKAADLGHENAKLKLETLSYKEDL